MAYPRKTPNRGGDRDLHGRTPPRLFPRRLLLGFGVVTLDGVALAERIWSDEV